MPAPTIRKLQIVLVLVCLLALLVPAAASAAVSGRPRSYDIQASLDYHKQTAVVSERLHYVNQTGVVLTTIAFEVVPQAYGAFTLVDAKVDGKSTKTYLEDASLELVLPTPLANGAAVDLEVDYRLDAPNQTNIRLGHHNGVIYLGNWYPTVQVYDRAKGDWPRYPYVETGDAFFSEVAEYRVALDVENAPDNLKVAHSGSLISQSGSSNSKHYVMGGSNLREFALTLSDLYLTLSTVVTHADGSQTTVNSYYLPNDSIGGEQIHNTAVDALKWGDEHLGIYPYPTLTLAEGIDPTGGGQEYAAMIIFGSGDYNSYKSYYLDYLIAHEVFHMWFYGVVGDNSVTEGWLDEGLVTFLGYRYIKTIRPLEFDSLWQSRVIDYYNAGVDKYGHLPLDTIVYDYVSDAQVFQVQYRQGALFYEELRSRFGDDQYYQLLREYVAAEKFGLATTVGFLSRILDKWPTSADIVASGVNPGEHYFTTSTLSALGLTPLP